MYPYNIINITNTDVILTDIFVSELHEEVGIYLWI